jgi:hypothetical protein
MSWSRVLFEKQIITQLVKKFHTFYSTWNFMTVFTKLKGRDYLGDLGVDGKVILK